MAGLSGTRERAKWERGGRASGSEGAMEGSAKGQQRAVWERAKWVKARRRRDGGISGSVPKWESSKWERGWGERSV